MLLHEILPYYHEAQRDAPYFLQLNPWHAPQSLGFNESSSHHNEERQLRQLHFKDKAKTAGLQVRHLYQVTYEAEVERPANEDANYPWTLDLGQNTHN